MLPAVDLRGVTRSLLLVTTALLLAYDVVPWATSTPGDTVSEVIRDRALAGWWLVPFWLGSIVGHWFGCGGGSAVVYVTGLALAVAAQVATVRAGWAPSLHHLLPIALAGVALGTAWPMRPPGGLTP